MTDHHADRQDVDVARSRERVQDRQGAGVVDVATDVGVENHALLRACRSQRYGGKRRGHQEGAEQGEWHKG